MSEGECNGRKKKRLQENEGNVSIWKWPDNNGEIER